MVLRIDSYIKTLLFSHNCVIIPSFGGFVGNYKGAEIHPTQHIFTAPCKQLVFNKNLNINDGLLANLIVQEEKVTYPEALEIIDKDVFKIKHLLSSGEKVELKSIGFLRLDVEKNIQFSPVSSTNYATSSFGLQSFQSSAIKRGGFVSEVGKTFIDRPSVKAKTGIKKYRKYALPLLVLPIAIILFLSPFSAVIKDKIQLQSSGFFYSTESKLYQPQTHSIDLPLAKIEPMKVIEESPVMASIQETKAAFAIEETTKVSTPMIDSATEPAAGSYTLISGCFAVLENAEKQVEQLKLKNINASIIGKTKNGLYRVGCGSYINPNEANQAMENLKTQQTEVWVLKN
jgi:cell division septation protein DedD